MDLMKIIFGIIGISGIALSSFVGYLVLVSENNPEKIEKKIREVNTYIFFFWIFSACTIWAMDFIEAYFFD